MTDLRLHKEAVHAFCARRLDQRDEDELALQVPRIYTCEPALPNHTVSLLGKLTHHLGGGDQVLDWLARHPGEPSLVAAVLRLGDLLEALSGRPAVLVAVRRVRDDRRRKQGTDPLAPYWAPTTDHVTLSDLSEAAKHMLRKDDGRGALEVSHRVLDLLDETFDVLEEGGSDVRTARSQAARIRDDLAQASTSSPARVAQFVTSGNRQ